jgi:cyclophilin family peptidyl-prolyl cis-trans isomerase
MTPISVIHLNFLRPLLSDTGGSRRPRITRNAPHRTATHGRTPTQGGDFTNHNGTGGESIYGRTFEDEWYVEENHLFVTHDRRGVLSMANSGKNTNGSQFFLTYGRTMHLDCRHVAFGMVVDGLDVLDKIERVRTSSGDVPTRKVVIADCGEVKSKDS